jgi:dihydroxyacid dehydratase/phosphogluconate dehydratase
VRRFARRIQPGDVVVIRNEGPRGGPGMREMGLASTDDLRRAFVQYRALFDDLLEIAPGLRPAQPAVR